MECHREIGCPEGELRAMLSRHLDGELSGPEAEAVEDHLKSCERCREEVASLRGLDRNIRHSVELTRASDGFVRRVMSAMSGRHRAAGSGDHAVPRAVVWGVAAVLAVGFAALVWAVVSWLFAGAPEPPRELGLALPASVPGLDAARPPSWRVRGPGSKRWSEITPGARVRVATELEIAADGGPGLIERSDGLRIHCAPGARFIIEPGATDEAGVSLATGRALVTIPRGAGRFELGLLDRPLDRSEALPGPAVALGDGASSVLITMRGAEAVITVISGKAMLTWATGAREISSGERAEVTDREGARDVARFDLRALDLDFAPPGLRVSPWPQMGGSAAREGRTPFRFALPPRKRLDLGAGAGMGGAVIGPDDTAYLLAGPEPGRLLGLRDEKVVASAALDETPVGTPAVTPDGAVVVATRTGVTRFSPDLARAERVVKLGPAEMPRAGPTVAPNGDLYVVLGAGLLAFAPDGRPRWRRDDIRSGSPPSVAPDGTVYVAAISGKLHALAPLTGEDRAPVSTPVDEPFLAHVAVASDGTAYAVSATRYLIWRSADGTSGRAALPVSEYVLAPAIMPSGEVVIASSGGVVLRLGPRPTEAPGRPFFEAGERIARGPVVDSGGRVAVWTASGKFIAIEPNGRSRSWDLGVEEGSAVAVSRGGGLLFVTRDGGCFGK